MSTTAMISALAGAIGKIQQAKSRLLSDYSYAQHQTEDRLLALSQDPRNERLLEQIINPDTGSPYTDSQIQQAILNAEIRASEKDLLLQHAFGASLEELQENINPATGIAYTEEEINQALANAELRGDIEDVEDRLYQMSLDPRNERSLEHIINPETGSPYTDAELQDAIANGEARENERIADEAAKTAKEEEERIARIGTLVPTGTDSHGGRYAGEPLVVWTPPDQLTPGYDSLIVAESVVPFHAAVLEQFPDATAGSNYRDLETQQYLYDTYGPYNPNTQTGAALPGTSNHESGLAVDYSIPQDDPHAYFAEMRDYILQNVHPDANVIIENNTGLWHIHIDFPPTEPVFS